MGKLRLGIHHHIGSEASLRNRKTAVQGEPMQIKKNFEKISSGEVLSFKLVGRGNPRKGTTQRVREKGGVKIKPRGENLFVKDTYGSKVTDTGKSWGHGRRKGWWGSPQSDQT